MSFVGTATKTDTYTDARLRAVMPEVSTDFWAMAGAGLIAYDTAAKWTADLTFILMKRAVKGWQVQIRRTGAAPIALDYRVSSDGTIRESGTGGGIDYNALPAGSTAGLFLELDYDSPNIAAVRQYTQEHGCGTNGQAVQGTSERDRAYSKDGFGIARNRIGTWPG